MSWAVERSSDFKADFALQAAWYAERGGADLVWRYEEAVEATLAKLARLGPLGRVRRFRAPELRGIRSTLVEPPFEVHVVFHRVEGRILSVERVLHGMRDLPRRLRQPPGA
ncbi:MAG TPA: type II toxin-antitoxin system RelE/ParE family toxin [Verrucomicrobiota bacterium]|nr:type II toxin-antitoxin system RelE/ParE family toxin [Verrucomicrobiota bacterium]